MEKNIIRAMVALSIVLATNVAAQQEKVVFQYDDSGNRESRHLEIQKSTEADSVFIDDPLPNLTKELEAKAYPNPTKGLITIEVFVSSDNPVTYVIADQNGKLVETGRFFQTGYSINLADQQPGVYFLRLSDLQSKVTYKIIKQ
ncbi:MAG: T9SS type A sorting domain-containing protein [Bacteroidales bacterium]